VKNFFIRKKSCCRRKMSNQLQEIQAIADTWRQDVCASRRIFKKQVEHEQVKEIGRLSRNMRNNSRNVKNSRQKERKELPVAEIHQIYARKAMATAAADNGEINQGECSSW
jgi:hypothetical protein